MGYNHFTHRVCLKVFLTDVIINTHTCIHTCTYAPPPPNTHTHMHTCTHTHTHAHTHTHTHTHTYAHMHAHTHTHTPQTVCSLVFSMFSCFSPYYSEEFKLESRRLSHRYNAPCDNLEDSADDPSLYWAIRW